MKYKVYKITNLINEKLYIGITKERYLSHRFWVHANGKQSKGMYLHRSIQKYGKENFSIELVMECDTAEKAKFKEINLIANLQLNKCRFPNGKGMNLTDGGEGSYGHKHTLKSIKKMSGKNNHNYGLLGGRNPTSRTIQQYTLDNIYVQQFGSMHEAARFLKPGCTKRQQCSIVSNIRSSIIGKCGATQAYGFKWKYT